MASETHPGTVEILLNWRSKLMLDEATREHSLDEFQQALAGVPVWDSVEYDNGKY